MSANETTTSKEKMNQYTQYHRITEIDVEISQSSHLVLEEEENTEEKEESTK